MAENTRDSGKRENKMGRVNIKIRKVTSAEGCGKMDSSLQFELNNVLDNIDD